jgi:hypothetical protein
MSHTNDIRGYMDPTPFDPLTGLGGGAFLSIKCTISFSARRSVVVHVQDNTSGSERDFTSILHDSTHNRDLNTVSRDDDSGGEGPSSGVDALLRASQAHSIDGLVLDVKPELCDSGEVQPFAQTDGGKDRVALKVDEDATLHQLTASMDQFSLTPVDEVLPIVQSENIYTYEFNGEGKLFKKCTLFKWITG